MNMEKQVRLTQIVEYAQGIGWLYDEGRNVLMAPEGEISIEMIAQLMASGTDVDEAFQKVLDQMEGNKKIPAPPKGGTGQSSLPNTQKEPKKEIPEGKTRILLESDDGVMDLMLDLPLQQVIANVLSMGKE